jgi:DNA-binding transcriptional ArsR family regulator
VVEDITRQIKSGALVAGERLASFTELAAAYDVSQGVITHAMSKLTACGLVETRRRSGSFVRAAEPRQAPQQAPERPRTESLNSFLAPRGSAVSQLTLYVSDVEPRALNVWRDILAEFADGRPTLQVDMLSCLDGHVEDIAAQRRLDIVETRPWLLSRLGHGFAAPPLGLINRRAEDFLPLLLPRLEAESLGGVPFLVMVHYLYANRDLLRDAGIEQWPPTDWLGLFAAAAQANQALAGKGRFGLARFGLHDYLAMAGAFHFDGQTLTVSKSRAAACITTYAESTASGADATRVLESFRAGEIAIMHHCSHESGPLRRSCDFDLAQTALPAAAGAEIPAQLTVLGMNRATACPQECLALLEHLCSDAVQTRFGREFGNVPAVTAAAMAPEIVDAHPAGADYRRAIEMSSGRWREPVIDAMRRCALLDPILEAPVNVDAATGRVLFALELNFPENLKVIP